MSTAFDLLQRVVQKEQRSILCEQIGVSAPIILTGKIASNYKSVKSNKLFGTTTYVAHIMNRKVGFRRLRRVSYRIPKEK